MNDRFVVGHLSPGRAAPIQGTRPANRTVATDSNEIPFRTLLDQQRLKFSHHAEQRLKQRGIELDADGLDRIAGAVDQAAAKGARDSLVLYRDIAMIVSVPSRTVVTAMDGASMKEHIFTQIDSAVVVG